MIKKLSTIGKKSCNENVIYVEKLCFKIFLQVSLKWIQKQSAIVHFRSIRLSLDGIQYHYLQIVTRSRNYKPYHLSH